MTKKTALVTATIAGLVCAFSWLIAEPSWEPLVTALGLVAALIAELATGHDTPTSTTVPTMAQKSGKGSKSIQAGGNVTIHKL